MSEDDEPQVGERRVPPPPPPLASPLGPPGAPPHPPVAPPPTPPWYGYGYGAPSQPSESKALAVLALVFSLLPVVLLSQIVGLVLGIVHLATHRGARRMAVTAIVLSVVMALVYLIALGAIVEANHHRHDTTVANGPSASPSPSPTPDAQPFEVPPRDLQVGECGNQPKNLHYITLLTIVPCTERHQFEVYAAFLLPAGRYPGLAKVRLLADRGCARRFTSFVGVPPGRSSLEYFTIHPLPESWAVDQFVHCLILTGPSVRGSVRDRHA